MYQKKLTRNKRGVGKFVLGATVGAVLGLLFAPKSGKELRKDLKVDFLRSKLANKESVFVTTNHKKMLEEASKIFKDNGYEIQTLDFSKPKKASFISFPNIH